MKNLYHLRAAGGLAFALLSACDGKPGEPPGGIAERTAILQESDANNPAYAFHRGNNRLPAYTVTVSSLPTKFLEAKKERIVLRDSTGNNTLSAEGSASHEKSRFLLASGPESVDDILAENVTDSATRKRIQRYRMKENSTYVLEIRESSASRNPRHIREYQIIDPTQGEHIGLVRSQNTTSARHRQHIYDIQLTNANPELESRLTLLLAIVDKQEDARDKKIDDDRAEAISDAIESFSGVFEE